MGICMALECSGVYSRQKVKEMLRCAQRRLTDLEKRLDFFSRYIPGEPTNSKKPLRLALVPLEPHFAASPPTREGLALQEGTNCKGTFVGVVGETGFSRRLPPTPLFTPW